MTSETSYVSFLYYWSALNELKEPSEFNFFPNYKYTHTHACIYTHAHTHIHILACISLHICIHLLVWVTLYFGTKIFLWNESYVSFEFSYRLHSLSIVTLGENEFFLSVLVLSRLVKYKKGAAPNSFK